MGGKENGSAGTDQAVGEGVDLFLQIRFQEQIKQWEKELSFLKERKLSTPKRLAWKDLEKAEKFERLAPSHKR